MIETITLENAREAMWEILNGLGYSQHHNDRLVEEVDAVLDDYVMLERNELEEIIAEVRSW